MDINKGLEEKLKHSQLLQWNTVNADVPLNFTKTVRMPVIV